MSKEASKPAARGPQWWAGDAEGTAADTGGASARRRGPGQRGAIACACGLFGAAVVWALAGPGGAHAQPRGISRAHAWSHVQLAGATHASAASMSLGQRRVLPWPLPTVWPTAVRYLRVDRGYAIVDKDPEAGFILFEFPIESPSCGSCQDRKGSGSLELFATTDASGRPSAQVQVTTEGGATYLPNAILDGLQAKLRDERGPPPPPPAKPPKPDGPKDPDAPKGRDGPKGPKAPKAPPAPDDGSPPQMPLDR